MRFAIVVFSSLLACPVWAAPADRPDARELFKNPPREYTLQAFWAWNGALQPAELRRQVDEMQSKGVHGAFLHARAGLDESATPYFSPGFWNAVRETVEYGRRQGFQTWLYDEDKWPSGAAGGRTIRANPARNTAIGLTHESLTFQGPRRVTLDYPDARFLVAARSIGGNRIDAASLAPLAPGSTWDVPAGEWRLSIFRPTQRREPLPNYLNPATVREFLDNTYEQYAKRFSGDFGKTIPGVFFDEIYNPVLAYDPLLEERFLAAKGYRLETVLPLLFLDGGPRTIQVRCDYFEVFTKLYEDAWFRQISEWCARHNLQWTGHTNEALRNLKDQGDYFRTMRHLQIPGTDNEDFRYTFPRVIGSWKPKQLSSVSHLYGKQRSMVEALGGGGWAITLDEARYGVNMLAVYGINQYVLHLFHYAMDTPVNMDDWPNSWFYQNPYWKYFEKFARHVNRLCYMGSQGEHVADVAVLYPAEEVWSEGARAGKPRVMAISEGLVDQLLAHQVDCDLVDTDSLLKSAAVPGGRARIGAENYRALLLPGVETVSLASYRKVRELAAQGVPVAAVGALPRHSAEHGENDPEVLRITAELFGAAGALSDPLPFLRRRVPADVEVVRGEAPALRVLHRRMGGIEAYFVVNSTQRAGVWRVRFAATGAVEQWNPEDGETSALPIVETSGGRTTLDLTLKPWGGYYVVFERGAAPKPVEPAATRVQSVKVAGPWTLQLAPVELDQSWKHDPGETIVALPVMEVRIGDRPWHNVKVADALNPRHGAARYLTAWDAAWITRYDYHRNFPGELGGAGLLFRREIEIPFDPASAWLTMAGDARFEGRVNGEAVLAGANWKQPATVERLPLRRGRNVVEVRVSDGGYLLAQGEIVGADGRRMNLATDGKWQVCGPDGVWAPAYEFARPPFGKWGDLPLRGQRQTLPVEVRYRARVPYGARSVEPGKVRGVHKLTMQGGQVELSVQVWNPEDGLQEPLQFRCRPMDARLGDWQQLGLGWYSGRGVYRTRFTLPGSYLGRKLTLDLGELRYTGEVWLNGKLVDTVAWPPYTVDISSNVRPGENRLVVVVANLLANQMRWNLFDAAVSTPVSRWWHDGNLLREPDKLRSGLIGPVRILAEE